MRGFVAPTSWARLARVTTSSSFSASQRSSTRRRPRAFGLRDGQVTVLIHSGSRGFGHQVCTDYVRLMDAVLARYHITLPDRQLACAPLSSPEGQRYLAAMACAANFAWGNRAVLAHRVRQAIAQILGPMVAAQTRQIYDVAHNVAKLERHQGRTLCVHRKGATRAFPPGSTEIPSAYREVGQPVFIPGSMGTSSFVLVGRHGAMERSFGTICHGAGRRMSRTGARREITGAELRRPARGSRDRCALPIKPGSRGGGAVRLQGRRTRRRCRRARRACRARRATCATGSGQRLSTASRGSVIASSEARTSEATRYSDWMVAWAPLRWPRPGTLAVSCGSLSAGSAGGGGDRHPRCQRNPLLVMAGGRERVDGRGLVGLPGTEDRRGEVGVVWRVGVVLGFQREPVALAVLPAAGAIERAVEEVARVELDPGLGRRDRQQASAGGVEQPCCQIEAAGCLGGLRTKLWS